MNCLVSATLLVVLNSCFFTATAYPPPPPPPPPPHNPCTGKGNGAFQYIPDCSKFLNCYNDMAFIQACPKGLFYNENDNCCEPYDETVFSHVVCGKKPIDVIPKPNPPGGFCQYLPNGQYTFKDDCGKFYNCWNGQTHVQKCQAGLFFNPDKNYCGYIDPKKVGCTVIKPSNNGICAGKQFGYFPDYYNCNNFFQCAHGQAYKQSCEPWLWFDKSILGCNYIDQVIAKGLYCLPPKYYGW